MSKNTSSTPLVSCVTGGLVGLTAFNTIGSVGLVGGFGGIGLGLGTITTAGIITGSALSTGFDTLQTGDVVGYSALGLGTLGGIAVYNTIGGVGVGIGGTAFGVGMAGMAFSGGVIGLGIYGLAKMFLESETSETFAQTYTRIEEKVSDLEAYNDAMAELDPVLATLALESKWRDIEIEEELQQLKYQVKINDQEIEKKKKLKEQYNKLKQEKDYLMCSLRLNYPSGKKLQMLLDIEKLEEKIKALEDRYYFLLIR